MAKKALKRYCIICGEVFYIKLTKSRRTGKNYRQRNSKTCSGDCSKKYNKQERAIIQTGKW